MGKNQAQNLKKIKFRNLGKKYCQEICCREKDGCAGCCVKQYNTWLERNKDALHNFQKDYKYVIGSKGSTVDIQLLLDWEKCKDCEGLVYKNNKLEELLKNESEIY